MSAPAARILDAVPETYVAHVSHKSDRTWTETNCYVDLWIELLHALGADPVPALASVLSSRFDGHQWTFLKFGPDDLRDLYGVEVGEMNIWQPVLAHVEENLRDGHFLTVEVDSYWLPDTTGTAYRTEHTKTTIVPNVVDAAAKYLEYFHNAGYFALCDDDFDGLWNLANTPAEVLLPYVEQVVVDPVRLARGATDGDVDLAVVRRHLARRPETNPVAALAAAVVSDAQWIASAGVGVFHKWSFGILRQCGAAAELAADLCDHLATRGIDVADGRSEFLEVARDAKVVQFQMARVAYGRAGKLDEPLQRMTDNWATAMDRLDRALRG